MGPLVDSVQLPYKWLNMVDITIVTGSYFMVYKPTNISGGPHLEGWTKLVRLTWLRIASILLASPAWNPPGATIFSAQISATVKGITQAVHPSNGRVWGSLSPRERREAEPGLSGWARNGQGFYFEQAVSSGNFLTVCSWNGSFVVDLPIKVGDTP